MIMGVESIGQSASARPFFANANITAQHVPFGSRVVNRPSFGEYQRLRL